MFKVLFTILTFVFAGTVYAQDYTTLTAVSEVELAEFWEKIDGEMKPESIWGDAKTDQERCQAEANYMAKFNKFCHVGPCIGRFEVLGGVVLATCPEHVYQGIECV